MKYDVFISYSRKDYVNSHGTVIRNSIVKRIKDALESENISFWFDQDGIYSGDQFAEVIVQNIISSKVFLFISTKASNQSIWAAKEIATANKFNKPILPFCYDDSDFSSKFLLYLVDQDKIEYAKDKRGAINRLLRSIKQKLEIIQRTAEITEEKKEGNSTNEYSFEDILSQDYDPRWNKLIEKIKENNVVPVIGTECLVNGQDNNLHRRIIKLLVQESDIQDIPQSFSELSDNPLFKSKFKGTTYLYPIIHRIFETNDRLEVTDTIKRLLGTRMFPFVLTTSFANVIEKYLIKIWEGNNIDVYSFGVHKESRKLSSFDVSKGDDLQRPGIYYLFGKENARSGTFAVTEEDYEKYLTSLLDNTSKPHNLLNSLHGKTLLFFGCSYSDWFFRFLISVFRKDTENDKLFVVTNDNVSNNFINYLRRNNIFVYDGYASFVDTLEEKLRDSDWNLSIPQKNADVYLSYTRRNLPFVERIATELTARGLKVWYDLTKLSGEHHLSQIEESIKTAKVFVPILSEHILNQTNTYHTYRFEWKVAIDTQKLIFDYKVIPIIFDNVITIHDLENNIPTEFNNNKCLNYKDHKSLLEICDTIISNIHTKS